MRWHQPNRQVPPAINPTNPTGDYRPEYVVWLKNKPVKKWDDIRKCLEAGVCDYAEYDGDEDGFIIRLHADKIVDGGFEYIFNVQFPVYDHAGWCYDIEEAQMPTKHWNLAQACAFMWRSDPELWTMGNY